MRIDVFGDFHSGKKDSLIEKHHDIREFFKQRYMPVLTLDLNTVKSDFHKGNIDSLTEKRHEILKVFKQKKMSVLLIDPNNEMPLEEIEGAFPDLYLKIFDLADCNENDFKRIDQHLDQYITDDGECAYDGLLFDNIDCINAGNDTEYLQTIVWESLARSNNLMCRCRLGETIPFDKMMIAVRCKEIPQHLFDDSTIIW